MSRSIHVQAHRGASREARENTLESVELASKMGVDSIEVDVQVLKDGIPVLFHDFILSEQAQINPARNGFLSNITFEELSAVQWKDTGLKIPTLQQVLLALSHFKEAQRPILDIELKYTEKNSLGPSKEEVVKKVLERVSLYPGKNFLAFRSFDWDLLEILNKKDPEFTTIPLLSQREKDWEGALKLKTPWVAPPVQNLKKEWIGKAHEQGTKVMVYTANTPEQWNHLMQVGVDGITTDFPRELLQLLKRL